MDSVAFVNEFLNNSDWWFANSKEIDEDLWNRFGGTEFVGHFTKTFRLSVHDIIYGDQLGRHAERLGVITVDQRCMIDEICCKFACECIRNMSELTVTKIFIMLCIRHSRNSALIRDHILARLPRYPPKLEILNGLYFKFWRATIEVCVNLIEPEYDAQPRTDFFEDIAVSHLSKNSPHSKNSTGKLPENVTIIGRELDVIHYQEYPNVTKYSMTNPKFRGVVNSIRHLVKDRKFILSYSGGIDSSLLLACSILVRKNIVAAVMINYGNRETADAEEEVCRRIAKMYDIPLVVRRISEVCRSRHSDDRAWYEKITREIRFKVYDQALKKYNGDAIILGHNADDVEENIISNIRKSIHLENLKGMLPESAENGITILRPWLNYPKSEIVDHVRNLNLAHAWNSTPEWCERGRIRNNVIPTLDIFDPSFMPGLVKFADDYSSITRWFIDQINSKRKCTITHANDTYLISFDEIDVTNYPNLMIIWRTIVNLAIEHISPRARVSNKAIENIISRESVAKKNIPRIYILTPLINVIVSNTIAFEINRG